MLGLHKGQLTSVAPGVDRPLQRSYPHTYAPLSVRQMNRADSFGGATSLSDMSLSHAHRSMESCQIGLDIS
jgi:hypothetical protein